MAVIAESDRPGAGIFFVMLGMASISVQDVLIKSLSDGYPLHQIVFTRSLIGLCFTLMLVQMEGGWRILRTPHWRIHLARGGLVICANMLYFTALASMTLAEATALYFVAPLFITILSVVVLKESVGLHRVTGIVIGFIGVLVVVRPGSGIFGLIALLPMLAAFSYAMMSVLTRKIGVADKASCMAFYIQVVFLVFSIIFGLAFGDGRYGRSGDPSIDFLLRAWVWPPMDDAILLGICGVTVAITGYCLSQAYRLAHAGLVAPFEYVALPLAVLWGITFFDEYPDVWTVAGILLIIASGLYITWRETVRRRWIAARVPARPESAP